MRGSPRALRLRPAVALRPLALVLVAACALIAAGAAVAGHGPKHLPGAEEYTEIVPPAQGTGRGGKGGAAEREVRADDKGSAIVDALTSREGYALALLAVLLLAILGLRVAAAQRRRRRLSRSHP